MLAVAFFLVFTPLAIGVGVGFLAGRWYQRVIDDTGDEWQPTVVLERARPDRVLPAAPIYQLRPRPNGPRGAA